MQLKRLHKFVQEGLVNGGQRRGVLEQGLVALRKLHKLKVVLQALLQHRHFGVVRRLWDDDSRVERLSPLTLQRWTGKCTGPRAYTPYTGLHLCTARERTDSNDEELHRINGPPVDLTTHAVPPRKSRNTCPNLELLCQGHAARISAQSSWIPFLHCPISRAPSPIGPSTTAPWPASRRPLSPLPHCPPNLLLPPPLQLPRVLPLLHPMSKGVLLP